MKRINFLLLLIGLTGCNDFMTPDTMAEGIEAMERCNNWQDETRKETTKYGMNYTLFNRSCELNRNKTMVLGSEGKYETGNSNEDRNIRKSWKVVKVFKLES